MSRDVLGWKKTFMQQKVKRGSLLIVAMATGATDLEVTRTNAVLSPSQIT